MVVFIYLYKLWRRSHEVFFMKFIHKKFLTIDDYRFFSRILIEGQYMRLGEAIFGFLGEFDLAPDFKHLWMDERTWKSLSVADKKAALFSIGIIEDDLEPASIIPLQSKHNSFGLCSRCFH